MVASFMHASSDHPNVLSITNVRIGRNDPPRTISYHPNMARKREPVQVVGPDWHLSEWMKTLKMKQADIIRETGWGKATMSDIVAGRTSYYRQIVNELARALKIEPWELLLPPEEVFHIRRLRQAVDEEHRLRLVAEQQRDFVGKQQDETRLTPRKLPTGPTRKRG